MKVKVKKKGKTRPGESLPHSTLFTTVILTPKVNTNTNYVKDSLDQQSQSFITIS